VVGKKLAHVLSQAVYLKEHNKEARP